MGDIASFIDVLTKQHKKQMDEQVRQHKEQMDAQAKEHRDKWTK